MNSLMKKNIRTEVIQLFFSTVGSVENIQTWSMMACMLALRGTSEHTTVSVQNKKRKTEERHPHTLSRCITNTASIWAHRSHQSAIQKNWKIQAQRSYLTFGTVSTCICQSILLINFDSTICWRMFSLSDGCNIIVTVMFLLRSGKEMSLLQVLLTQRWLIYSDSLRKSLPDGL